MEANERDDGGAGDVKARIAEIRRVLRLPDAEAGRFDRIRFLRGADAWLQEYRSGDGRGDQAAALLHVRVMQALRDWERVVVTVRSIDWRKASTRAKALLQAAEAHANLQEFTSATRCLDEVLRLSPDSGDRVAAVKGRLEALSRVEMYGRLSALVHSAARSGDAAAAESFFRAAAYVWGMPVQAAEEAASVLRVLVAGGQDGPASAGSETPIHSCRVVMTCGSGYSGTGAVTAFLREYEGLTMPFGLRELAVLKKNHGFSPLIAKWDGLSRDEREEARRNVVLQAILGIPFQTSAVVSDRLTTRSITLNSLFAGEELGSGDARVLGAMTRAFVRETAGDITREELERACARFVNRLLRMRGGEIALFNNCIHQTRMFMCGLLENARVIVVKRDPRDQYVAHQTETQGRGTTVEAFIRKRKRADAAVAGYLATGAGNAMCVGFEAFVTDQSVREEVGQWAGVAHLPLPRKPRHFFPEMSQKNIGIHSIWKKQSEIRLIEQELRDQLVDM